MGERSPDTLVVTEANRDAAKLLTGWRTWPGGALALTGPAGSGKTHLALAWALEAGRAPASRRAPRPTMPPRFSARPAGGCSSTTPTAARRSACSGAPRPRPHRGRGGAAGRRRRPRIGRADSPILRSRLAALPVARLGEPDEALMEVVLRRVCREQFIQLSDDAAKYLARRLPRTFAAAHALAAALDADLVKGAQGRSLWRRRAWR